MFNKIRFGLVAALSIISVSVASATPNQWTTVGPLVMNGKSVMAYSDCDYRVQIAGSSDNRITLPIRSSAIGTPEAKATRSSFQVAIPESWSSSTDNISNVLQGLITGLHNRYPTLEGYSITDFAINVGTIKTTPVKISRLYAEIKVAAIDPVFGLETIYRYTNTRVAFPEIVLQQKCPNR